SKVALRVASASCSSGLQFFNKLRGNVVAESSGIAAHQARANRLIFERWAEQLETSLVPRRSRTLGSVSALNELLTLAEGFLRSGGQPRPGADRVRSTQCRHERPPAQTATAANPCKPDRSSRSCEVHRL